MSNFPTGWIDSPQAVQQYITARSLAGDSAILADARPDLQGYWPRLVLSGQFAVLLYEAELSVLGEYLPADFQRRGTCVGRGTYRAVQTGYWDAIRERRIVGEPEQIAWEPGYIGSRVNVGNGVLGNSDGAVVAWAAQWYHDYGAIPRARYDEIDLTQQQEQLACDNAVRGRGVPRSLAAHGVGHECDAYHVSSAEELADVTAARYASAIGSTHQQSDRRDSNGECGYQGRTNHCEAIVGVYLRPTWDGNPATIYDHTAFVDQQSWGKIPDGPDVLRIYKGDAKLRQGAYGTPMRDMRRRMPTGETWALRLRQGWVADSVKGALK